jgi:CubicO group peptidase (beta-lactamase class C family)
MLEEGGEVTADWCRPPPGRHFADCARSNHHPAPYIASPNSAAAIVSRPPGSVDKAGIERGGCCLSITLRDYARLGMFMDEGGRAGGVDVLADGWIRDAWTPQLSEPDKYVIGFGYYWQIRQDGGYEAVGAYGQSVTIYPKEHLVIAVNSASVDHHGIGLARWDLIAAIDKAVR